MTLQQLVAGDGMPPIRLSAPPLVDLANGPDSTLACLQFAVLLVGQMRGYTRFMLTGRALHAIGSAAEPARDLQPAVVVLEDVDLVAEDRSFGPGSSSVLFDLLDAMDGAAGDADLLFVLTTNRADLLDSGQQLTRSLLGVGNDPETLPPGGGLGSLPPQPGRGSVGRHQLRHPRRFDA